MVRDIGLTSRELHGTGGEGTGLRLRAAQAGVMGDIGFDLGLG